MGLFSIFRGFGGGGNRITGELDELHAGFTRDGFHWFRQLPRRALMPFSWPGEHDRMHTIIMLPALNAHDLPRRAAFLTPIDCAVLQSSPRTGAMCSRSRTACW